MNQVDRNWPPLIVVREKSFWIIVRDAVLTTLMWVVFLTMLEGEFEFIFPGAVSRSGLNDLLGWIGIDDSTPKLDALQFGATLLPYLGVSLLLILSLLSFAVDTIARRRAALRGPKPPPLDPAAEAHHADLATMAGYVDPTEPLETLDVDEDHVLELDVRQILAVLNHRDEAALEDARALRIANVHVTTDGHYRILGPAAP